MLHIIKKKSVVYTETKASDESNSEIYRLLSKIMLISMVVTLLIQYNITDNNQHTFHSLKYQILIIYSPNGVVFILFLGY